jgi:hypothetical protein
MVIVTTHQGDQIRRIFAPWPLGSCFKTTEALHIFWLLFPRWRLCINFYKNGLAYIFLGFPPNSSSHPATHVPELLWRSDESRMSFHALAHTPQWGAHFRSIGKSHGSLGTKNVTFLSENGHCVQAWNTNAEILAMLNFEISFLNTSSTLGVNFHPEIELLPLGTQSILENNSGGEHWVFTPWVPP